MTRSTTWQSLDLLLAPFGDTDPDRVAVGDVDSTDRVARLSEVFRLSSLETGLLVAAVAPELDPVAATAIGLLSGGGPAAISVGLALELAGESPLSSAGRAALGPMGSLRRWGLIDIVNGDWQLGRSMIAPEDLIAGLLGRPSMEPITAAMTVELLDPTTAPPGSTALIASLRAGRRVTWIEEPPGASGVSLAEAGFAGADLRCIVFDLARRPHGCSLQTAVVAAVRHAGLLACGVILESGEELVDDTSAPAVARLLFASPVPIVVVGRCRWNPLWHPSLPGVIRASPLSVRERITFWRAAGVGPAIGEEILAGFRLRPDRIVAAARHVVEEAALKGDEPDPAQLTETIRMLSGTSARAEATPLTLSDIELPEESAAALTRLASWIQLRDAVASRGDAYGLGGKKSGIAALFAGGPGTGKTLAAHVLADTTGFELRQVDLSGVIDKYIGETEKKLEKVFEEAESISNVILFFDEADALFGTRSQVRDARDRYANQEVSYLLQRMEQFDGVTVLATNLRGNLDPAFARRLHFIIAFPDPDPATRRRLWLGLLARCGGLDPADPVDVDLLAHTVEMAGGDLRNIVLAATFDAVAQDSDVGMRHVVAATVREHSKLGRRVPGVLLG